MFARMSFLSTCSAQTFISLQIHTKESVNIQVFSLTYKCSVIYFGCNTKYCIQNIWSCPCMCQNSIFFAFICKIYWLSEKNDRYIAMGFGQNVLKPVISIILDFCFHKQRHIWHEIFVLFWILYDALNVPWKKKKNTCMKTIQFLLWPPWVLTGIVISCIYLSVHPSVCLSVHCEQRCHSKS